MKIGILISGRGSNMQALVKAAAEPDYPAEVAVVISNRPDALGLEYARHVGLPAVTIDHKAYDSREAFERELDRVLRQYGTELICNAGFMRLLTAGFVDAWHDRQINIHPSLLPAYKGLHSHERVLADGVKITGCSVHFVRTAMDAGPIIAQAAVPVLEGDEPGDLAARVLQAEHQLYPHALKLVAEGRARVRDEKVVIDGNDRAAPALFSPLIGARD
ncbi:MAG: phosphoribosylglycinamide formyltransferase [Hyphomicrobiales bacterium]|nr:MAG: phosphoribosylglycinamide formyltransferase [Hyphomicrobiales bacterium]